LPEAVTSTPARTSCALRLLALPFDWSGPLRIAAAPKVFLSLGDAAHVSLAEAREQARQAHSLRELGKDPKVEWEHQARLHREAPSVEDLIRQRIDAMERTSIAKTVMEYRRILKAEIYGSGFGALRAKDVRRADVRAFLVARLGRTAVAPSTADVRGSQANEWRWRSDLLRKPSREPLRELRPLGRRAQQGHRGHLRLP
jgi:hypothetical protein